MITPEELHQELQHRTLAIPDVTERQNAGIHEDAFFVGRTMFMHMKLFAIGAASCGVIAVPVRWICLIRRIIREGVNRRDNT
jgi:hypothetical protein